MDTIIQVAPFVQPIDYAAKNDAKKNQDDTIIGFLLRKGGLNGTADWYEDKDKICTDGKDDGHLSFKEGFKSFLKGLIGGIPKAIIKHPIATAFTVATAAGLIFITGGAAAPLLWGIGTTFAVGMTGVGIYKVITAKTDGAAKAALEMTGTGTTSMLLSGATYKTTIASAEKAGVDISGNIIQTMKNSVQISTRNIKANYLYWKTGIIAQGSNATRNGVEMIYLGDEKPAKVYKINIDPKATVHQNEMRNPGVFYTGTGDEYYVQTSWGTYVNIDPKAPKGNIFINGDGRYAVSGTEFSKTFVDSAKFAENGTRAYIDPTTIKPGTHFVATEQAPAAFKIVPEGTKFIGSEGLTTVHPKNVLRFDYQGMPYQSSVDLIFRDCKSLTPSQITQLKAVDPEAALSYGY